jgi:hypothetical protein
LKICIIHIGKNLLDEKLGITQKTLSIAQSLLDKKCQVKIVSFAPENSINERPTSGIDFVYFSPNNKWQMIDQWLDQNISKGELIWFRYPFANSNFLNITKKWGAQMVLEHNTFETEEALITQKKTWRNLTFRLSKSYIKFTWDTWIKKQTDEHRWGPLVMQSVLGGICVTHEISDYEKSRHPTYKTFVLPNCIDDLDWPDLPQKPHRMSSRQKWVMVIGNLSEWHGIGRLLQILHQKIPDHIHLQIDFIGIENLDVFSPSSHSKIEINILGKMKSDDLKKKLLEYDLAIGSLALHKISIQEACPLKVREYWRCGLPVILAYHDSACIENKALLNYNFQIPNDNSPLPFTAITEFLEKLNSNPDWKHQLQTTAKSTISYSAKTDALISFLKSLPYPVDHHS